MDNVSGLADASKKFASFLRVAGKFNYNFVYIFHIIYPGKAIWRLIISQTNIFNIFPASVPLNGIRRILESICVRKTDKCIPQSALWVNRLFIELANKNERVCLMLDCSGNNINGPRKFKTDEDKPDFQISYFNDLNDEQL